MSFHGGSSPVKAGMKDQSSSNIARDGAAKRPQGSFATTHGMRDVTAELGKVGPGNPGVGPDASSANPLDPSVQGKKVQSSFDTKWGMRDANGKSINGVHSGQAVLDEASHLGKY
jgi:hypothetical protein